MQELGKFNLKLRKVLRKVKLEIISDRDIYIFFEKCMRGGVFKYI